MEVYKLRNPPRFALCSQKIRQLKPVAVDEDIVRPEVAMSKVERFKKSDSLRKVVHPYFPHR